MNFVEVKCRNCGGNMKIPENSSRVVCEFCLTEYVLTPDKNETPEVRGIDYAGNGPLFKAYIPNGWNYRIIDDNSFSLLAPICKGLQLFEQNGAMLVFLPFAYYKELGKKSPSFIPLPGLGASARDYDFDGFSLVRYRHLAPAEQYARERIAAMCGADNIELKALEFDTLQNKAADFSQQASQKLGAPVTLDGGKFGFSFSSNGKEYGGYFSTVIARADRTQQNQPGDITDIFKKGLNFMGSLYGIGGTATFDWGRAFDIMLTFPRGSDNENSYEQIFDRFTAEIDYAPLYYAMQDQELRNTQQVQINGAMQRQQTAINASQNISRTLSQTSDIVNQACADHSRQMDRIYDNSSDGIRGVNTYTDSAGNTYKADVSYDHIYKGINNTFVASKNGGLELGPQWEELNLK